MPEVGSASLAIIPSFKGFQSELERGSGKALAAAGKDGGEKFGDEAAKEGGKGFSSKIGPLLKKGALAAGGVAGIAFGVGLAGALDKGRLEDKLAAQLGAGAKQAKRLGGVAGDLYANAYGDSLGSVNDSVRAVVQNLGGMRRASDKELTATTAKVLDLNAAFDEDASAITRAADQMVRTGLAKNAKQALDIITKGFQSGANEADDLLDTFNEYGTQFRKLGIGGKKAVGLLSQGLKGGARDADLVADTFKEFSIRAIDGSELTGASFKALGLNADDMAEKIAKGGKTAADATQLTLEKLRAVEDPAKRAQIAVGLFGTQSEDMGKALYRLDLSKAEKQIGKVGGAARRMGDVLNDNAATKIETFKRQMQTKLVDFLGNKVIPFVESDVVPTLKKIGDALDNLPSWAIKGSVGGVLGLLAAGKIGGLVGNLRGLRGGGGGGGLGGVISKGKPVPVFVTNKGFGDGTGLPGKKGGKVPLVATGLTAAAIAAGSHAAIKANKGRDISPALGGAPAAAGGGFSLPKNALDFSDGMDETTDSIIRANDAASKLPNQFEAGKTAGQNLADVVLGVKRGIEAVPTTHATRFDAPNLLTILSQTREYKGMLEGLDGRTVNTFIKTTRLRNDIGESGDPRFGGFRAHGGAMHPGYSYMVGENGPERVTVGARSTVEPNAGGDTTFVLMLDGEALDYRMRRVADDRYNANRHHPTGRRR